MRTRLRLVSDLLTSREKRALPKVAGAMMLAGLTTFIGVGAILPFFNVVTDPATITNSETLSFFYEALGFESKRSFTIALGVATFVATVLSNAGAAVAEWVRLRYQWKVRHGIARRMLHSYLSRDYEYFLTHNTSNIHQNILKESMDFVTGIVLPGLVVLQNGIIAVALLGLVLWVDTTVSLIAAGVLGGAYVVIYLTSRNFLTTIGQKRMQATSERFRIVSEAFGGIKFIKLLSREQYYRDKFEEPSATDARYRAILSLWQSVPRYGIEAVAFGGILFFLLVMMLEGQGVNEFIPTLAVFAFAGYRVLPAFQQILGAVSRFRFNDELLSRIHQEFKEDSGRRTTVLSEEAVEESQELQFEDSVVFDDVSFWYEGADGTPALRQMSLEIPCGSSVALVGKTGCGKTTTVDVLLGLLSPREGRVLIDGVPLVGERVERWQCRTGYVPQDIYLTDDTIASNIAFGLPEDEIELDRVRECASVAQIDQFIETELVDSYRTTVGERGVRLSGGQRQRIGIARALYHDPEVVVFDEATSDLDTVTERRICEAIERMGRSKTMVFVSHRLTTVERCDRIYVLEEGRVVSEGSYGELLETSQSFRRFVDEGARSGVVG